MAKAKRPPAAEYRLLIAPRFSEHEQRNKTLLHLETTQMFSTFRYDLSVQEVLSPKSIRLKILGLRTPQRSLPSSGPAQFSREYDGLKGTYDISIEGLDGNVSTFSVRITSKGVALLKSPRTKFVDITVEQSLRSQS